MKLQKSDRAITYHVIASEYGWTIDEIDNAPWDVLSEMLVVLKTSREPKPKKSEGKKKHGS